METFFAQAPRLNPKVKLITGVVCGVRVEASILREEPSAAKVAKN